MNNSIDRLCTQIGERLCHKNWTISCAESCTGGGVAFALTRIAGSSRWFNQSLVTYSNAAKQTLLGVPQQVLENHGAVSAETVLAMAQGCASAAAAEVSVSVSGIAGPGGGSADKPVGLVWFGFYIDGNCHTSQRVFAGDRQQIREQAIEYALTEVGNYLQGVS